MKLSIVTTLYKSAAHVEEFHRRASEAARHVTDDYEIVMVDDGSPDESLRIACGIAKQDEHVRVVELSRNFGHHKALMAGLKHARGDFTFLIDSDLEEDPALLHKFLEKLLSGDHDVVYGFAAARGGGPMKKFGGELGWRLIRLLHAVEIPRNHCTVRLMRREYVDALLLHQDSSTIIGGLWIVTGFRQIGLPIDKAYRSETSYSFLLRLVALINGISSFSTIPLNVMAIFGMAVALASFFVGIFVIMEKLVYNTAAGWASLIISIWLVGGMIILCLGIIGIYISRIFVETKKWPAVIVRRIHQNNGDEH